MSIALYYLLSIMSALTPTPELIDNHPGRYYDDRGDVISTCAEINGVDWCYDRARVRVEA